MAVEFSVPFAGFSSCTAGNPLAEPKAFAGNASSNASIHVNQTREAPHGCPRGYSQHLAAMDQDCEINYCVSTNALNAQVTAQVKRPPFMQVPALQSPRTDNQVVFDQASRTWYRNEKSAAYSSMVNLMKTSVGSDNKYDPDFLMPSNAFRAWLQESQARAFNRTIHLAYQDPSAFRGQVAAPPQSSSDTFLTFTVTPTVAAGIGIAATLAFVILFTLGVMGAQALRRRENGGYTRHQDATSVKE